MRRIVTLLGAVLLLLGAPQAATAASLDGVSISLDRNFGTHAVGTTTTHTVTIVNRGDTAVPVSGFGVSSQSGAFLFVFGSNTCFTPDAVLDPGESCSYDIAFTPLSTGTLTGTTDIAIGDGFTLLKLRGRGV